MIRETELIATNTKFSKARHLQQISQLFLHFPEYNNFQENKFIRGIIFRTFPTKSNCPILQYNSTNKSKRKIDLPVSNCMV